jgi:hypothetical protein
LQELRDIRAACPGPWVVAGDFNLIYRDEDKNNANYNRAMRVVSEGSSMIWLSKRYPCMVASKRGQTSKTLQPW